MAVSDLALLHIVTKFSCGEIFLQQVFLIVSSRCLTVRGQHCFEVGRKEVVMIIDAFTIGGAIMSLVMTIVVFYLALHNQSYSDDRG